MLPGDGIGVEVTAAAVQVLEAVARTHQIPIELIPDVAGGAAIDAYGVAIRPETVQRCKRAAAILFGAVGDPRWDDANALAKARPGEAILGLRKALSLYANLRPVRVDPALVDSSTLRPEVVTGVGPSELRHRNCHRSKISQQFHRCTRTTGDPARNYAREPRDIHEKKSASIPLSAVKMANR